MLLRNLKCHYVHEEIHFISSCRKATFQDGEASISSFALAKHFIQI